MSTVTRFKPSSPFANILSELSRYLTPHRYRKRERWVAALPDFIDVHRSIAKDQYRYVDQPRRNYARPAGAWVRYLAPSQAHLLSAANIEPYALTALTAVEIVHRAARGEALAGFKTPSAVFGADFILRFEGIERSDC